MNRTTIAPRKTFPARPPRCRKAAVAFALLLSGCGTPPSVVPVMQVVHRALLDEAQQVATAEAARDDLHLQHARRALWEGYRADLTTKDNPTPAWIEDATAGFVLAREALLRQELDLIQQRRTRQENLQAAAAAQTRAIELLQQRDRLRPQALDLDYWTNRFTPLETPR